MTKEKVSVTLDTDLVNRIKKLPGSGLSAKIEALLTQALASQKPKPETVGDLVGLRVELEKISRLTSTHDEDISDYEQRLTDLEDWKESMPHFAAVDDITEVEALPEQVRELRTQIAEMRQLLLEKQ